MEKRSGEGKGEGEKAGGVKQEEKAVERGHNTTSPISGKKRKGRKGAGPAMGKKGKNKAAKRPAR
jgi:hypothetical protein